MNLLTAVQGVMELLIVVVGFLFYSTLLASNVGFLKYAVITDFTKVPLIKSIISLAHR